MRFIFQVLGLIMQGIGYHLIGYGCALFFIAALLVTSALAVVMLATLLAA